MQRVDSNVNLTLLSTLTLNVGETDLVDSSFPHGYNCIVAISSPAGDDYNIWSGPNVPVTNTKGDLDHNLVAQGTIENKFIGTEIGQWQKNEQLQNVFQRWS